MHTLTWTAAIGIMLAGPLQAAEKPRNAAPPETLSAGAYTATVKAIVCDGCAKFITKTLAKNESLEKIEVDAETKQVAFSVKKGAKVRLEDLQTELDKSAELMGMGANYTLSDVKKAGTKS